MHYRTLISVEDFLMSGLPPDWLVIDCRFDLANVRWGEAAYRESHIPGAYFAHLDHDLSGSRRAGAGRHPLPDLRQFAERLGQWGLRRNSQVVVYDQDNGSYAARLWWMLRLMGHETVALLDGGWSAWRAAGGAGESSVPRLQSRSYEARPGSGWVTSRQIERNLSVDRYLLVDARSSERFRGEREPIDPVAGHVPGARNWPFTRNLQKNGLFLAADTLRGQWEVFLDGRAPGSVVHMCGSGVTACHNLLAMEVAGLAGSGLYVGSWSEWISDGRRPVAVGAE